MEVLAGSWIAATQGRLAIVSWHLCMVTMHCESGAP